jgi:dGTP triphosphohydrolase
MRTQKAVAMKDRLEGNEFYNDFDVETWEGPRSCEYRTPFEQDRDRLIHTATFRRLQGKTQVFLSGEYDFYRTRLTHSLEEPKSGVRSANGLSEVTEVVGCSEMISTSIQLVWRRFAWRTT